MKRVRGRVEIIQDAKVANTEGVTPSFIAFEEFAYVGLVSEVIDGVDEMRKDRMVLTAKFLEILVGVRINNDRPTT